MRKVMLINVTHSEESRVAILSDKVLQAFEIESLGREHLKGNIYKGVVHRIHPALEAAFVDIGAERDAFLPIDEICFRNLRNPPANDGEAGENGRRRRRIRDLLRPGEEILVQIAKEQFANKPPTLTTFYSLPGRYLVLLPGSDETGISRRIEGEERVRLRKLIEDLDPPEGFGVIVRTAAGADEEPSELARDFAYLQRLWENVQRAAHGKRPPALVYREHDIVLRTIRDFYTADIDEIHVDNEDVFQRARDFLHDVMPGREHVLRLYQGEQPIFSAFDVEAQIESIFRRRVQLRSGASIVIDGTEALTAIDVNSGGSVRGHNPEETAFRTNLEAAAEIARQMRLRDIGGLIVVDFIDMRDSSHVHEVERAMRDSMHVDKARHELGRISRFGLMEISRQRLRPAAMATTYTGCPMCEGHGAVRTTESAALVALRKIHNRVAIGDVASLHAALPGGVAVYLLNQKRDELARLEQRYDSRIQVDLDDRLMPHQMEIEVKSRPAAPPAARVLPGTVAQVEAPPAAQVAANGEGNGKKKRRRRGRRRGSTLRAAIALGEALFVLGRAAGLATAAAPVQSEPPLQDEDDTDESMDESADETASSEAQDAAEAPVAEVAPSTQPSGRRRRRRRSGGRRARAEAAPLAATTGAEPATALAAALPEPADAQPAERQPEQAAEEPPVAAKRRRGGTGRRAAVKPSAPRDAGADAAPDAGAESAAAGASRPRSRSRAPKKEAATKPRRAKTAAKTGASPRRRRATSSEQRTPATE